MMPDVCQFNVAVWLERTFPVALIVTDRLPSASVAVFWLAWAALAVLYRLVRLVSINPACD